MFKRLAIAVIIFTFSVIPAYAADTNTKVLFSPRGGISKELVRLYAEATRDIKVCMYSFVAKYQANALIAAHKRGVKVQVFLDKKLNYKKTGKAAAGSMSTILARAGIPVRYFTPVGGSMHHKFILVDGKTVVSGSYNLSNDAEFRSNEAMFFSTDEKIVAAFEAEFDKLWIIGKEH